ncbi:transposase [Paraburkholderia aspalathi]|nr:transposase [Paraburkholderia aspalathi]
MELTLQSGASVARIAREHNLNDSMVFKWRRRYRDAQAKGLQTHAAPVVRWSQHEPRAVPART